MAVVTVLEVQAIMEPNSLTSTQIDPMILAAHELLLVALAGTTMSAALLKEIERWFVAHMIACTLAKTITEEQIGDARVKYTGYFSKKLESTPYGQMVLTLDTSGKMTKLGKQAASLTAIISFES